MKGLILFFSLLLPSLGLTQQYSIDWFKVAGGGGTSTGEVFSVSGIIGQPDAGGGMSGGDFFVMGGFWSLISVMQTPGAPLLTITRSGANAIISWPFSSAQFVLEQNSTVHTTNWSSVTNSVSDNGTTRSVTVTASPGDNFYRLKKE